MSRRNNQSTNGNNGSKKKSKVPNNNSSQSSNSRSGSKKGNAMSKGSLPQKSAASAYASGQVGKSPQIKQTNDSCRIVHRELISSVTGTVAFTVANTFALNPGIALSFPWLSQIAQNWEKYKFNKLKFCFYTRTGSTTPGSFMMAPDYDAADAAPQTEQIASSFVGTAEDAPWKDIECILPAEKLCSEKSKFVRTGGLASNLDIKTYDSGNLFVCTVDGTAVPWGKLWVEYDVTFMIPQLPPSGTNVNGGQIFGGGTQSAANPLGTVPLLNANARGISVDALSNVTFQNPGYYYVQFGNVVGTVITDLVATAGAGAPVVADETSFIVNAGGTAATQSYNVTVTVPNSVVAFTATATTITAAALTVGSLPLNSD